jgi:hypothetical protein
MPRHIKVAAARMGPSALLLQLATEKEPNR